MKAENKIFDLTPLGLLCITGDQAKKFLQGQLTCNLDDITPTQSRLGAHCNPQGRIISFFHLLMYHHHYFLQMPRELIPIAKQALQKYAVFFKVTLTDVSDEFSQLGYVGNDLTTMPKTLHEQYSTDKMVAIRLQDTPACYQFIGETTAIANLKNELNIATVNDFNAWKAMQIAQHIPAIYPETSEKFLPHDLDLPLLNAISFVKGCYTGQEIIARMQYRGKLKNHLFHAKINSPLTLTRGADIYLDNKSCGSIVDFCLLDNTDYEVLVIAQENDVKTHPLTIDLDKKYFLNF